MSSLSTSAPLALSSDVEEINTKELAQRISAELKRYSIPQAIFAQRVLCRSQGTLSDLLRNPKPWSKLKSGRETFRRMAKWLQEPEYQRMSALRLAGEIKMLNTNHTRCFCLHSSLGETWDDVCMSSHRIGVTLVMSWRTHVQVFNVFNKSSCVGSFLDYVMMERGKCNPCG